MTDIVERLRHNANADAPAYIVSEQLNEAAEEITKLRGEIEQFKQERRDAKNFVKQQHNTTGSNSLLRLSLKYLHEDMKAKDKECEALRELVEECQHNHIILTTDAYAEFLDALDQTQSTQDASTSNELSKTRGVKP